MIRRAVEFGRRAWSEVLIARGELATLLGFVRDTHADVRELNRKVVRLVQQTKLPCFVSGTGVVTFRIGDVVQDAIVDAKPQEIPISTGIAWLAPGEGADLRIQPQAPLGKIVLRVEAPFVLTDVRVGLNSKMYGSYPNVCREVGFDGCNLGMIIFCRVEYPAEDSR